MTLQKRDEKKPYKNSHLFYSSLQGIYPVLIKASGCRDQSICFLQCFYRQKSQRCLSRVKLVEQSYFCSMKDYSALYLFPWRDMHAILNEKISYNVIVYIHLNTYTIEFICTHIYDTTTSKKMMYSHIYVYIYKYQHEPQRSFLRGV